MILDQIVAHTRAELAGRKEWVPLAEVKKLAVLQLPARSLAATLSGGDIKLIAEVKKASPSRGVICRDFDPVRIARAYASSGASAISVLTEEKYFMGRLAYLKDIRDDLGSNGPPLLRKDFIIDPYQVYESRASGADALLLIAAILTPDRLKELLDLSHELGMECLVETHNETEIEMALSVGARIIGINNRDLQTFNVDIRTTGRLRPLIPPDRLVVSESGIRGRDDMQKMKQWGVSAVLVGEALVSAPDIGEKMKELLG
ncbi:MAG: indole-3-glycerol phosphate synthase TrpC [Dehalococcoidia bacterium]|nr:MAG: indole-3-glycerol phosphate synthase TrpC [Dehalococcoidia bacterium]